MPNTHMQEDRDFAPAGEVRDRIEAFLSPIGALGPAGHLGPIPEIEKELDLIAAAIRTFHAKPPDLVMRECSAYSARLTELLVLIHRREAGSRLWLKVRTQQVDRFLEEIDRQWKTASRLIEVSRQDIDLSRGQ